ncbi:MAG TPA: Os1348 family NHLP clan protein [Candidatus Polarisedimenticolaceae bacterium]|nr:Os1348 family NHLP clan protein [Candidatus Polarisedimenticolaceae bacterium]
MSQDNVERVIGRLLTDEAFRNRFCEDPETALAGLVEDGMTLNPCEVRALAALDARWIFGFADAVDPRIQKTDLSGGRR